MKVPFTWLAEGGIRRRIYIVVFDAEAMPDRHLDHQGRRY